ncbi:MAG: hypothetical protein FWD61_17850, partial [Phycisphaerales bacterium]|nr:hypothetical protein [Phycisphaerales bacterium]
GALIVMLTGAGWDVRDEGNLWVAGVGARTLGNVMVSGGGRGYLIAVGMMAVVLASALVGGMYLARVRKGADPEPGPVRRIAAAPERGSGGGGKR